MNEQVENITCREMHNSKRVERQRRRQKRQRAQEKATKQTQTTTTRLPFIFYDTRPGNPVCLLYQSIAPHWPNIRRILLFFFQNGYHHHHRHPHYQRELYVLVRLLYTNNEYSLSSPLPVLLIFVSIRISEVRLQNDYSKTVAGKYTTQYNRSP